MAARLFSHFHIPDLRIFLRRLRRDESGAIAVMMAVAVSLLVGMLTLAVEFGSWYVARRGLQTAADAAAISAALERARGNLDGASAVALREAHRNGFLTDATTSFVLNVPPTSGPYAGRGDAVEAILQDRQERLFSRLFLSSDTTVSARAVATVGNGGKACVLALDPAQAGAIQGSGSATVNLPGCLLASDSKSSASIDLTGVVIVKAQSMWSAGGLSQGSNVTVNLDIPPTLNASPLADPYANVQVGTVGPCDYTSLVKVTNNQTKTFTPGVYCGGIQITGGTVTFKPGTYYIVDGKLDVNGGTLKGQYSTSTDGVTFVFTTRGVTGTNIGGMDIRGNAVLSLRAPADLSNPFHGLLFYQDRRAPVGAVNKLNGGSYTDVEGAVYFPNQELDWAGTNGTASPSCTQIVAKTVTFLGNATLGVDQCGSRGVSQILTSVTQLGE
ncbi:pilus assembly protein TadG-related protein [Azospirillum sp. sgz302134]